MPRSVPETNDNGEHGDELIVHRRTGYTNVPNDLSNDPRLAFREVGVLVWMLGRPPRWRFAADRTAARSPREGRDAILASLRILREAGYVHVTRVRGEGGTFVTRTEVADWPKWAESSATGVGSTDSGRPASGEPASGDPHSSVTNESHYRESEELPPVAPPRAREDAAAVGAVLRAVADAPRRQHVAELFEQWWTVYPRRVGKDAARKAYDRAIRRATPLEVLAGAERYRDDPTREAAYTAHPSTWLNAGRWADEGPVRPDEAQRPARGRVAEGDAVLRAEWEAAQLRDDPRRLGRAVQALELEAGQA